VSYRCSCNICEYERLACERERLAVPKLDLPQELPPGRAYVIEDQRDTNAYVAPALSMENAKEAIAAWTFKDQEILYRWLHTLKCRM
jgi:hypothetical protein